MKTDDTTNCCCFVDVARRSSSWSTPLLLITVSMLMVTQSFTTQSFTSSPVMKRTSSSLHPLAYRGGGGSSSFTTEEEEVVIMAPSSSSSSEATNRQEQQELLLYQPPFFDAYSDEIIPILRRDSDEDDESEENHLMLPQQQTGSNPLLDFYNHQILETYWGPRIVLTIIAGIYGTNFALGSYMNDAMPDSSVVTAFRMTLASFALSPFLFQIQSKLLARSIWCGCFTAAGYVTQSLALADTDPARVSFLGAATVLWLPILEIVIDKAKLGWKDSPQTWIAALFCLCGVGLLELENFELVFKTGDLLALAQAVGFGTGCFLSAKLVREEPSQILPITSVLIAVSAVLSWVWCAAAGTLPAAVHQFVDGPTTLLQQPAVVGALLWTGLVSTSLNFVAEISALGKVPTSEASVLLASEPIWAALFASLLYGTTMTQSDYVGGGLILLACLVNALVRPDDIQRLWGGARTGENEKKE